MSTRPPGAAGLAALVAASLLAGCSAANLEVRPRSQRLDVRIDPASGEIAVESATEIEVLSPAAAPGRRSIVELELHPDLAVDSVDISGATLVRHRRGRRAGDGDGAIEPSSLRLVLRDAVAVVRIDLAYRGKLRQDVTAGEVEGQVHNFAVQAHVGEEGVYLEPDGYWYPRLAATGPADADRALSDFELVADPVEGFELVAGLETVESADGRLRWTSPFPLPGLVLLGGPLDRHTRTHRDITLHAVVAPGKEAVAEDILAASAEYLDRYEPLIGDYPFAEFTVLEAFFSSGFAFPACTQIAGSQLSEYKQYRRHGYLDHELLHNWWGNGILVDPDDGNWCEGLASYMANYYGHVLDGDDAAARKQRRNHSNFLSAIEPEEDKPLGTFGLDGGAGRGIGYQKGAAVFHMLERKIGHEALHAGLRILTEERMGEHIGWETIREAIERASGENLALFFEQWVRRGGAPRLEMTSAEWSPGRARVMVTLEQQGTELELDVPLRLYYGDRHADEVVTVDRATQRLEIPCEPEGLTAVELDPDFHLFRKLDPEEVMPTSALTRRAKRLLIVLPDEEVAEPYRAVADSFTRAVLGDGDEPDEGHEVIEQKASDLDPVELAKSSVLVLGESVRAPAVQELLGRSRSPVRWGPSSFQVGATEYGAPGEAIFMTVHHPDRPELGVTVYHGNGPRALSNARVLTFYPNSLLVFDTPAGVEATDASGMPRARVVERIDLEFPDRVEF